MPTDTNPYAYSADYSAIAACLAAIRQQQIAGVFNADPALLHQLDIFEKTTLQKLYERCITLLSTADGAIPGSAAYLQGSFEEVDFSSLDFSVGTIPSFSGSYSDLFQFNLQIFTYFNTRPGILSDASKTSIDAVLIPVLDAFDELTDYLDSANLNPCTQAGSAYLNNSTGLFLQTSGSDGSGGIAAGIHLRWSLAGVLGENHFPRGNYSNNVDNPSGYNKANDYVTIERTVYNSPVRVTLNLETARPIINFFLRRWTYVVNHTINGIQVSDRIRITFADAQQYEQLAAQLGPLISPFEFLKQYNGMLTLEILNKKAFSAGVDFRKIAPAQETVLKLQAFCVTDTTNTENEIVTIRKILSPGNAAAVTEVIYGENMYLFKLQKTDNGFLQSFSYETYDDFLKSKNTSDWTAVGENFSLSLDQTTVFNRLETTAFPIDNLWPQFTGGSKVRIANYQDKWLTSYPNEPAISQAVSRYLELSETDPQANDTFRQDGADPQSPGLEISYLDILHIISLDYHIARMLGLGYIDTPTGDNLTRYVYRINYTARQNLNSPETANLFYMSLPTAMSDMRRPAKAVARPVSYGMPAADMLSNTMVDENGYAKFEDSRVINVGRQLYREEAAGYDFFSDTDGDDLNPFETPRPVLFGIEYRAATQTGYQKPEITHQDNGDHVYINYNINYPDGGVIETVPVPDNSTSLYVHFEKSAGIHRYAIYSIDLLARCSDTSDEVGTDETMFAARNRLTAPNDFSVQYIQNEDTLVFTTQTEQQWLNRRTDQFPGQDVSFTRVNFNWLDVTNISYLTNPSDISAALLAKPDKIKAYFKTGKPLEVIGLIYDIIPVTGSDNQLQLYTKGYQLVDGTAVNPILAPADIDKFIGSLLNTKDGQFVVIHIEIGLSGPIITVEMQGNMETVEDPGGAALYAAKKTYNRPFLNSRFSMVENLSRIESWMAVFETISLVNPGNPLAPAIETFVDDEGNHTTFMVGGINGGAIVSTVMPQDENEQALPGYYKITFAAGVTLNPHPQTNLPFDPDNPNANNPSGLQGPHVEWNKGLVRVPFASNASEKKTIQVIKIQQADPLVLYAYDPAYQNRPVSLSTNDGDWISGVNFHPGYKAYLFPEPPPTYQFNSTSLLPGPGADSQKVMFGLQSANSQGNQNFQSGISIPSLLLTKKIVEPEQLNAPLLASYKVRPDITGKAAATFDLRIDPDDNGAARQPFGFMFYRTTEEDVLYALYNPATIQLILTAIAELIADDNHNQRFSELVNVVLDDHMHFRVFDALPAPYGFPDPDKTGLVAGDDSDGVKYAKYLAAVRSTLLPLTEQPPVNILIKEGYKTENTAPVIRTIDGKLLDPASQQFNPFPMVRKYPGDGNTYYIRFTDYTLNASSRKLHYYTVAEVTNQLAPGRLSYFAGPVTVLHTVAATAPVIRSFAISLATVSSGSPLSVVFRIGQFSPADEVSKVRIFRTLDKANTVSLSAMDVSADIALTADMAVSPEVSDIFQDLAKTPLGETVYYRLASIRTIINEKEHPEDIVSIGSEVITVNLIDITNPVAPSITYDPASRCLSWPATISKGTYYLYQQNNRGNWQKIQTSPPGEMTYTLPPGLQFTDDSGNPVYYRFKVSVQNASGLFNLSDNEKTIGQNTIL